ncbi:MAG TPA: adenylosuccinate synthetase [Thermoanaerobaculia bacterium]|jgi:adenylosuccinate synthase|nr:adenylosuccinate synthetase [Thermoanaerobaculia bacterium]
MPSQIVVVLSGPIAAGKTTLADSLEKRFSFARFKTRELIRTILGTEPAREALQKAGEDLDRESNGTWVAAALTKQILDAQATGPDGRILVDSVRLISQVEAIRNAFGRNVVHVHITAPYEILARRYAARIATIQELATYEHVKADPTEAQVETLQDVADIVIDTSQATEEDVVIRVAARLGLYGRSVDQLVDVLVGGQYGSEGKGHIADHLAPEYDVLMRVGGPNAGHTVFEEPEPYVFHLLPSGTRRNTAAKIVLGAGMVLEVEQLLREINQNEVPPERLTIDPQAMIIDPGDIEFEKEWLRDTIGSTAQGVGSATSRKVLRTGAQFPVRLARDVPEFSRYLRPAVEILEETFTRGQRVLLEGTQGTGLSLHHGNYAWVTSRDTTASGALAEAGIGPCRVRKVVMVVRTYPIRVQNPPVDGATSGPMGRELDWQDVSDRSGIPVDELRKKEKTSTTKKDRRVAEFDWALLRRAATLNSPTDIALSFTDYLSIENRKARRYEQLTSPTLRFIEEIERVAIAPVSLIVTRFAFRSIIDRRAWS